MSFTIDWTSGHVPVWREHLGRYAGMPALALEVGCFEGRSTCWFLENILTHPASQIVCVDTFAGSAELRDMPQLEGLQARFDDNVRAFGSKVVKFVGASTAVLPLLAPGAFDFAYIDGSHAAADVFSDLVLAWRLVKTGGILVLDDYEWGAGNPERDRPKIAIDAFLASFERRYQILTKAYQVLLTKTARDGD